MIIDKVFTLPSDADGREKICERIATKHGFLDVSVIGRSILSRKVEAFFIGGGKRYVVILGAHHALESITSNLSYMLVDALLSLKHKNDIYGIMQVTDTIFREVFP